MWSFTFTFPQSANPGLAKVIFGAIGLPIGLLMVLMTVSATTERNGRQRSALMLMFIFIYIKGSELFTGNTAVVGAAYLEKKVRQRGKD